MENYLEEETSVQIIDVTAIEAQDRALIDRQIATAKQYPRNITKATNNAIAIVSMDKETAQVCHYSVPRGGKQISGPSVHLAKIVAQNWGNMRIQARVINVDRTHVTSQATCFDLETNIAIQIEVKRSIMTKNGRMSEDMITVTGNAANSIALRNAIYAVIPKQVIDKVYNAAKKMIAGDVSDATKLAVRTKQVIDGFKDTYGVTEAELLGAIGKAAVQFITADDLVNLVGIGTALKDGDTTVEEAFRKKKTGGNGAEVADDIFADQKKKSEEAKKDKPAAPAAETKAPEKPAETPSGISDQVKQTIAGMEDWDTFAAYVNGLTHLHMNKDFTKLVRDKEKTFKTKGKTIIQL